MAIFAVTHPVISIVVFMVSLYMSGLNLVLEQTRSSWENPVETAERINQTWQQANEVLTEKLQSGQPLNEVDLLALIGTQSEKTGFEDRLFNQILLRFVSLIGVSLSSILVLMAWKPDLIYANKP